ncbi:MAG: SDR family NAD(P)-dependent oxidoreductase, partial [Flavisolibacter sp.]|nr:SDR family NAD(P)-dependent oxidoreductase [Flavisolibacter sp.]
GSIWLKNNKNQQMKTVIITGANGNLGTAVTNAFLAKNYKVIATVRKEEDLKELPQHKNLQVEVLDLTNEEKTEAFVHKIIDQHKTIDGALLLVGGFAMGDISATKSEDVKKQISLNFDTAYHVTRPLFQHMMEQNKGKIIFIGARPALQASAGKNLIAYGLSKSLLFKLAEYLNAEAKGKNVTVSVVAPSTIDTEPNRKSMPDADFDKWVKPEALAEVLEFMISEKGNVLREPVLKVYNNA